MLFMINTRDTMFYSFINNNNIYPWLTSFSLGKMEEEQKHLVLINWATKHYINPSFLKEKMNQDLSHFESLVKTASDL